MTDKRGALADAEARGAPTPNPQSPSSTASSAMGDRAAESDELPQCPECDTQIIALDDVTQSYETHGEKAEWKAPRWKCPLCQLELVGEHDNDNHSLAMQRMFQRVIAKQDRAAWAVKVLDAWAEDDDERTWSSGWRYMATEAFCVLHLDATDRHRKSFSGANPEAARIAAAEALVASDPSLNVQPEPSRDAHQATTSSPSDDNRADPRYPLSWQDGPVIWALALKMLGPDGNVRGIRPAEAGDLKRLGYVPSQPPSLDGAAWVRFSVTDENSNWPPEGERVALMTCSGDMFLGRLVWDAETDPQLDDDGLGYGIRDLTHWAPHKFPPPPKPEEP